MSVTICMACAIPQLVVEKADVNDKRLIHYVIYQRVHFWYFFGC